MKKQRAGDSPSQPPHRWRHPRATQQKVSKSGKISKNYSKALKTLNLVNAGLSYNERQQPFSATRKKKQRNRRANKLPGTHSKTQNFRPNTRRQRWLS